MDSPLSLRDEAVAIARATPVPLLGAGLTLLVAGYLAGSLATGLGDDPEFELGGTASSPAVATLVMLALAGALGWSLGGRGPRALAVAALLLALGQLLWVAHRAGIGDRTSQAVAELVVAALLFAGAVWWCQLRQGRLPSWELEARLDRIGRSVAMAIPVGPAAVALISLLVVIFVTGTRTFVTGSADEGRVVGWVSGALLAAPAALALLLGRTPGATRWPLVLAGVLGLMAIDETHAVHDRLEYRASVAAVLILAPLVVLGALAWLGTLRVLPGGRATRLFVAGGALWLLDLLLDALFESPLTWLLEEYSEFAGSSCLLLALLLAVQSAQSPTAEGRIPAVAALRRREPVG
jgi:hypothetical protein